MPTTLSEFQRCSQAQKGQITLAYSMRYLAVQQEWDYKHQQTVQKCFRCDMSNSAERKFNRIRMQYSKSNLIHTIKVSLNTALTYFKCTFLTLIAVLQPYSLGENVLLVYSVLHSLQDEQCGRLLTSSGGYSTR